MTFDLRTISLLSTERFKVVDAFDEDVKCGVAGFLNAKNKAVSHF
jgi:hypothetical protein